MDTAPRSVAATPCARCTVDPSGEKGHAALAHYVGGPYPGQNIFKCADCGERWIRSYGGTEERHAWTRFVHLLPSNRGLPARALPVRHAV